MQALCSGVASKNSDEHARTEGADIKARIAQLNAEISRRIAEVATAQAGFAKLSSLLPLAERRKADLQALARQGFTAGHAGQDRTRERIGTERDLLAQQARLREAEAGLTESRQNKSAYRAEVERDLSERLAKSTQRQAQLQPQGIKTAQRQRLAELRAPVAGKVQQLAVHTAGGVVTPAQALMVIVPVDGDLTVDVALDSKDIGFVRVGQTAAVKFETFSYTR